MIEKGHTIPVLDHGYVRLVDWMGSDLRIVEAARISYKSPSKGEEADKKLLAYLFKHKHTSPFEQVCVAFNIKMPIFVMRQYARHRMHSLNEFSGRYSEMPDEFYMPKEWRAQDDKNKQGSSGMATDSDFCNHLLREAYATAYDSYKRLLGQGIAKELARIVLPVGCYTEIYCRWDLNNLLKFFTLRDDGHAQAEIREFSQAMKAITRELFPWTMELYDASRAMQR